MSNINIHAGDFRKGKYGNFRSGKFHLTSNDGGLFGYKGKTYTPDMVEVLDVASEESVKRIGGTVGWGVAGAVILGPVGLLAGLLLGGKGKNVNFVAKFSDGRKMLATTDSKTFTAMQAAVF
mgnify:CR=1 FL=1